MTTSPNPKDDGGPAFPIPIAGCTDGGVYNALEQSAGQLGGMTLRDYFAAKALQGLCANPGGPFQACSRSGWTLVNCTYDQVSAEAYALADSMIRARQENPNG